MIKLLNQLKMFWQAIRNPPSEFEQYLASSVDHYDLESRSRRFYYGKGWP